MTLHRILLLFSVRLYRMSNHKRQSRMFNLNVCPVCLITNACLQQQTMSRLLLFGLFHCALYIEARHLRLSVCANGDALLEVAGELTLSVVRNLNGTRLARSNGFLGVGRYRAAARGHSLVDDERSLSDVGEREDAFLHGIRLREGAEVV